LGAFQLVWRKSVSPPMAPAKRACTSFTTGTTGPGCATSPSHSSRAHAATPTSARHRERLRPLPVVQRATRLVAQRRDRCCRDAISAASDPRRAAWAWRRYVSAARGAPSERLCELRYESLAADPETTAGQLAGFLDVPATALAQALQTARDTSVGRWARELPPADLAEVEEECGELLGALGYLR